MVVMSSTASVRRRIEMCQESRKTCMLSRATLEVGRAQRIRVELISWGERLCTWIAAMRTNFFCKNCKWIFSLKEVFQFKLCCSNRDSQSWIHT